MCLFTQLIGSPFSLSMQADFQYCAIQTSSGPRTFMKLVAVVAAQLRSLPVHALCYLDNVLVLSSSLPQTVKDISLVISAFQRHGFSINREKSHLVLATHIVHLGAVIDSEIGQVFLSPARIRSIIYLVGQVLSQ